jgi:hypothetical protein
VPALCGLKEAAILRRTKFGSLDFIDTRPIEKLRPPHGSFEHLSNLGELYCESVRRSVLPAELAGLSLWKYQHSGYAR